MMKLFSFALLGLAGALLSAQVAEAGPRRGCCKCAPSCCAVNVAVAPSAVDKNVPPAPAAPTADAQVYRSYSYEPQDTGYRTYSRSSGRSYNRFDAGNKMRGQY